MTVGWLRRAAKLSIHNVKAAVKAIPSCVAPMHSMLALRRNTVCAVRNTQRCHAKRLAWSTRTSQAI